MEPSSLEFSNMILEARKFRHWETECRPVTGPASCSSPFCGSFAEEGKRAFCRCSVAQRSRGFYYQLRKPTQTRPSTDWQDWHWTWCCLHIGIGVLAGINLGTGKVLKLVGDGISQPPLLVVISGSLAMRNLRQGRIPDPAILEDQV